MSDVPDFTTATTTYTRLAAAGGPTLGGTVFNVPLQVTDESIYVLLNHIPPVGADVIVVGHTTGCKYSETGLKQNTSQAFVISPALGSADTSVDVTISSDPGITYAVIATDEGSADNQINGPHSFTLLGPLPIPVDNNAGFSLAVTESDGSTEQGNHLLLNNTNGTLVPAPPAGKLNVVDLVTFQGQTAAGGVTLRFGTVAGQIFAQLDLGASGVGNPILQPKLVTAQAINAQWGVANNLSVNAAWHTVNVTE